jgi:carbonic anhydrase
MTEPIGSPHNFSHHPDSEYPTSAGARGRRRFLQAAGAATALGLATKVGMNLAAPEVALAQSELTPDAALQELVAGNQRFAGGRMTSFEQDLVILKQNTIEKQEPFAAVLSCADSRVPVELASLEYGALVLGTKVILVMGHANCGAAKAAIQGKSVPGQISALFPHLQPAVDKSGPDLEATTKTNAKLQAALLRESSTVISGMVKEGKLKVIAAYYDIGTGKVTLLE